MSTTELDARVGVADRRAGSQVFRVAMLGATVCLVAVASIAASSPAARTSENIPVEQLQFYQSREGLTFAKGWGDPAVGPHSNFIRLPGGYASPLHIHTSDYYGVVASGVVSNERRAQPDRALRPGSYWFQRGGEPHTTKCLSQEDCLIFVTAHGKFDIRVVPEPSSLEKVTGRRP